MLSISVKPERYSYDIIKESGEFVVNLVTKDMAYETDFCGVKSGKDIDKFKELGLKEAESKIVKVPGIDKSPVNIECKVVEVKELGSHSMFIAKVVSVNVNEALIDETGRFNLNQADLLTYSHGEYYSLGKKVGTFGYSVKRKKNKKRR